MVSPNDFVHVALEGRILAGSVYLTYTNKSTSSFTFVILKSSQLSMIRLSITRKKTVDLSNSYYYRTTVNTTTKIIWAICLKQKL